MRARSTITELSPADGRWRAFATAHATSPLQSPSWLDAMACAYHLRARITALTDERGTIVAGLPMIRSKLPWRRRWTALPFTDTFEPMAVDAAARDELLARLAQGGSPERILVRTRAAVPGWFSRQVGTVQVFDLSGGVEQVLRGARSKTRQNVRLARKSGLTARAIVRREEFLGASLAVTVDSRRRLGAPTQPQRYWSKIWSLHEREQAFTIGVYRNERLLANATFIVGCGHAVFKYSASDTATRDLRSNYLAFATALEHMVERGVSTMDFGITDLRNESLRRYKRHWGGEEHAAHFSATDPGMLPDSLEPGPLLTGAIQRSPAFVGRTVGFAYPFAA
jgi:hypothetical protein